MSSRPRLHLVSVKKEYLDAHYKISVDRSCIVLLPVALWPNLLFAAAVLKVVLRQNVSQKILSPLQVPRLQNGAVTLPQLEDERI